MRNVGAGSESGEGQGLLDIRVLNATNRRKHVLPMPTWDTLTPPRRMSSTQSPLLAQSRDIRVLDGGLGTALEAHGADISTPLWSSGLLSTVKGRQIIESVHREYIEAGAEIILTSSYQASLQAFHDYGLDEKEAEKCLSDCLALALSAREGARRTTSQTIVVALSLGPYGAFIPGAQEYTGDYGFNLPRLDDPTAELCSHPRLVEWWRRRLLEWVSTPRFDELDAIIFETLPSVVEAASIIDALAECPTVTQARLVVFSFTARAGQTGRGDDLGLLGAIISRAKARLGPTCTPGLGLNCTDITSLSSLLPALAPAPTSADDGAPPCWPVLALYPNGSGLSASEWARELHRIGRVALDRRMASTVLLGGCCHTGPEHIRELRRLVPLDRDVTR